jgi:fructose-1-phosphate kinase PfkB-like protein
MHITILEFAPCADAIYHIRRDEDEGYVSGDNQTVTLKSGAKLRPRLVSTYAGGKATNVARVLEKLLSESDTAEVDLVVFRPNSPEGRYIHELQTRALERVHINPVIVPAVSRVCIDLIDPATDRSNRVEFNVSPRPLWEPGVAETALEFVSSLTADLLILAGNPPRIEGGGSADDLYARIIERTEGRIAAVSMDCEKSALAKSITTRRQPDVVKINENEFRSVDGRIWLKFRGTLIVTTANGCRVEIGGGEPVEVPGVSVGNLYSTVGAGDAVHAGFTLARWVRGWDMIKAALYGQAAAAAAVTSPEGTRGVTKETVDQFFAELNRK